MTASEPLATAGPPWAAHWTEVNYTLRLSERPFYFARKRNGENKMTVNFNFTPEQMESFRKIGHIGGTTSARNMTARERRERALKAAHSPKAKAWREKVAALARQEREVESHA